MTEGFEFTQEAPELISTGAQSLIQNADRLGLKWRFSFATVSIASPMMAVYDGDSTAIPMLNILDRTPVVGERVAVIHVPPSNHVIVGSLTPPTWVDYSDSVVWSASTPPVLNNGTISARYKNSGDLVIVAYSLQMGSTTTYGAGAWTLSLPVAARASTDGFVGAGMAYDVSSSTNSRPVSLHLNSSTTIAMFSVTGFVAINNPLTWATGDLLRGSIAYEPA